MVDLRTPAEIARDEKYQRICSAYLALSNKMPEASANRIINHIAQNEGMTAVGVKNIIIAKGLYHSKKQ